MAKLVILGTASAVPDATHDNTHLALSCEDGSVLVDCGTSPIVSLKRAGLDPDHLQALIVTHFHPDHVSGASIFLLNLWLTGRKHPLAIHALRGTLAKVQAMMNLFEYSNWPEFYPVSFKAVNSFEGALVLEMGDLSIAASPTHHLVPSIAIKATSQTSGRSVVYSSDTSPCDAVVRLARGADLLVHEATGAASGHSSAAMAGSIARQAGVGHLTLIHYYTTVRPDDLIAQARFTFDGPVTVARDLDVFEF